MIQFKSVTVCFSKRDEILNNINLTIDKGEFVVITGQSGAGKSTLLRLIYFEVVPTEGEVLLSFKPVGERFTSLKAKDHQIARLRRRMGIVFQDFKLLQDRNVFDNVAFAMRVIGLPSKMIKSKVLKILGQLGILHRQYHMPLTLSGGEQQRVALARALVNEPFVLLADEPTGNLDEANSREIIRILKEINMQGTAVIMVTHALDLIQGLDTKHYIIEDGRIITKESRRA